MNIGIENITLDEKQKEAIQSAFLHPITVITGPGGSGKSLICKYICDIANEKGLSLRLMSPTGKAAQVLSGKTGFPASTIHRSLKMTPQEEFPREDISEDIIIVDEISMSGIDTMYAIMVAMETNLWGNVVFVGDANQLPSVSPGNFLFDIIESGIANVVKLNKIHRQDEKSYIALLANEISKGKLVEIPPDASDIKWHNVTTETYQQKIESFVNHYLESNDIEDLQIISPMKKGICGVHNTNEIIQNLMAKRNGTEETKMERGFDKFYKGDRVIQTENNYDKMVFNGDMGIIVELGEKVKDSSVSDQKEKYIVVDFYGEKYTYFSDETNELQLAWCITVHKFQGSQSKNVVFVMMPEATIMMSKELVYTAFTRAEKRLDVFGDKSMLRLAPTKSIIKKRYTSLVGLINEQRKGTELFIELANKNTKSNGSEEQ